MYDWVYVYTFINVSVCVCVCGRRFKWRKYVIHTHTRTQSGGIVYTYMLYGNLIAWDYSFWKCHYSARDIWAYTLQYVIRGILNNIIIVPNDNNDDDDQMLITFLYTN